MSSAFLLLSALATSTLALPHPHTKRDTIAINTGLTYKPTTNPSQLTLSTDATSFGKPQVVGKGWAQWPDQGASHASYLCQNDSLTRESWAWIFGDTAVSGIWIPKDYQLDSDKYLATCGDTFDSMQIAADDKIGDGVARVGYNLAELPSDPDLKGQASLQGVRYYATENIGKYIDASQPSYVMIG